MKICRKNSSADIKIGEGEGVGVPDISAEVPLACGADHERQNVTLQSMEVHGESQIHLQPTEHPSELLKEGFDCWESHIGADILVELVTHGGHTLEQPVPEELHP